MTFDIPKKPSLNDIESKWLTRWDRDHTGQEASGTRHR